MDRATARARVLALMSDGQPRTIRRIAYELGLGYSTVGQLVREGALARIGEKKKESPLQRQGQPIVVHRDFAQRLVGATSAALDLPSARKRS